MPEVQPSIFLCSCFLVLRTPLAGDVAKDFNGADMSPKVFGGSASPTEREV